MCNLWKRKWKKHSFIKLCLVWLVWTGNLEDTHLFDPRIVHFFLLVFEFQRSLSGRTNGQTKKRKTKLLILSFLFFMWFIRSMCTSHHDLSSTVSNVMLCLPTTGFYMAEVVPPVFTPPPVVDQSIHGVSEVKPEMIGGRQSGKRKHKLNGQSSEKAWRWAKNKNKTSNTKRKIS